MANGGISAFTRPAAHLTALNDEALYLGTIEALAVAIDAKDHSLRDRLRRIQAYAIEVGRELGLSGPGLDAQRTAALLHDIGKLAVPKHILCKPLKLTQEEFDKVKIHPIVSAEDSRSGFDSLVPSLRSCALIMKNGMARDTHMG